MGRQLYTFSICLLPTRCIFHNLQNLLSLLIYPMYVHSLHWYSVQNVYQPFLHISSEVISLMGAESCLFRCFTNTLIFAKLTLKPFGYWFFPLSLEYPAKDITIKEVISISKFPLPSSFKLLCHGLAALITRREINTE